MELNHPLSGPTIFYKVLFRSFCGHGIALLVLDHRGFFFLAWDFFYSDKRCEPVNVLYFYLNSFFVVYIELLFVVFLMKKLVHFVFVDYGPLFYSCEIGSHLLWREKAMFFIIVCSTPLKSVYVFVHVFWSNLVPIIPGHLTTKVLEYRNKLLLAQFFFFWVRSNLLLAVHVLHFEHFYDLLGGGWIFALGQVAVL